MMEKAETLAEALPREIERNRELLSHFKAIGGPGVFGAAMLAQDIQMAEQATTEGDVVAMLQAYNTLSENEG